MKEIGIDADYLCRILKDLLCIPSPTGMTDQVVRYMCAELQRLEIPFELTRLGAIRADLKGRRSTPDRAVACHVDTLGAIIKGFHTANGWPQLAPIGTWSARMAEGARVIVFSDRERRTPGTILPLKASGHTYGDEIDTQPSSWTNLELRLDAHVTCEQHARDLGIEIGDIVAVEPQPVFNRNGYIVSRHLDDKAGVATLLAAAKAIRESKVQLPMDCHLLFTISEEVGVGASHILQGDVAEMVSVDNGTIATGQYTCEHGVTIAMQDSSGPFDWHLTRSLIGLCKSFDINHSRDVFNHYRSDNAAALEAGNDIRTALVCFGLDASHGYERVHIDSLISVARLMMLYMQSPALFERDSEALGPVGDLPASTDEDH
jgi:peptidase M42 family hydrolase